MAILGWSSAHTSSPRCAAANAEIHTSSGSGLTAGVPFALDANERVSHENKFVADEQVLPATISGTASPRGLAPRPSPRDGYQSSPSSYVFARRQERIGANSRNSLPSAAKRVRREARVQQGKVERRGGAPFPAVTHPLSLSLSWPPSLAPLHGLFRGEHSGSTQGQLKLTAIYCISIMVSHLPAPPCILLLCTAARPPRRPSSHLLFRRTCNTRARLHSRFTTSFMVHTRRARVWRTQKDPTANYPRRLPRPGDCIIPRKLSRATRARNACDF